MIRARNVNNTAIITHKPTSTLHGRYNDVFVFSFFIGFANIHSRVELVNFNCFNLWLLLFVCNLQKSHLLVLSIASMILRSYQASVLRSGKVHAPQVHPKDWTKLTDTTWYNVASPSWTCHNVRDNHNHLDKPMLKGGIKQHNSMEDKNNRIWKKHIFTRL